MLDANKYLGERLVERYHIVKEIGRGASSIVFYAEDMMTKADDGSPMPVALKILDRDSNEYKLNSKSFYTETRAVVGMPANPHTVAVQDVSYDYDRDVHFIVMEYVKGTTLRRYMHSHGSFSAREIISIALQVLYALRSAHEANVVHRDVKPQNILVQNEKESGDGVTLPGGRGMPYIKLADFGIARLPGEDLFAMGDRGVGTVHYISPEQAGGGVIDARSDIYSLGVVMYELATGRVPFDADNATAVITKHQTSAATHVRVFNPSIPLSLDQIIFTAMQKDPRKRYKDAAAMEKRLMDALDELNGAAAKAATAKNITHAPALVYKKERKPRDKKKIKKILATVMSAVAVVAIVVSLGIMIPKWIDSTDVVNVVVPRLENTVYDENATYDEGITVKVSGTQHSEEFPEGTIISQTPAAGVEISGNVTIEVVVSLGPEPIDFSLPLVYREDFETARNYLAGLKIEDPRMKFFISDEPVVLPYDEAKGAIGEVVGVRYEDGTEIDINNGKVKKNATLVLVTNGWGEYFELPISQRADDRTTPVQYDLSYQKAKAYIEAEYEGSIVVDGFDSASDYDEIGWNSQGVATYSVVAARIVGTSVLINLDGDRLNIPPNGVLHIVLIINI